MNRINTPRRPQARGAGLLLALAAMPWVLSGCLFLSPDDDGARGLQVEFVADAQQEADGGLARVPVTPLSVLSRESGLRAEARLSITDPQVESVELLENSPLVLGAFDLQSGTRAVTGTLDFEPGVDGSTYALEAVILYRGLEELAANGNGLAGNWTGDIGFEAGNLEVRIDSLTLDSPGNDNVYNGSLQLSHPSIDPANIVPVPISGLIYDPVDGSLDYSYSFPDLQLVEWDESIDGMEIIEVSIDASIAESVVFSGSTEVVVDGLVITVAEDTVVLTPELSSANPDQIDVGRRIKGTITVAVYSNDGDNLPKAANVILSESGTVAVQR